MTIMVAARTPVSAGSRPQSLQAGPIRAKVTTDSRYERVPVGGRVKFHDLVVTVPSRASPKLKRLSRVKRRICGEAASGVSTSSHSDRNSVNSHIGREAACQFEACAFQFEACALL